MPAWHSRARCRGHPYRSRPASRTDPAQEGSALNADARYPEELRYTPEHEWLRVQREADAGAVIVRVGITAYAQDALGDIVFVTLPQVGEQVQAGQALGEVESTKSVSDVYAPVAGTVQARNDALEAHPELVNNDPYGEGWLLELEVAGGAAALEEGGLLDAEAYQQLLD